MKKTIHILSAVLACTTLLPQAASAREGENVRIAVDVPYTPFEYRTADGKLTGFEIELGDALCAEAKLKCSWVEQSWDGIIPGLLARKYDAILSSMSITPEREKQVLFSEPYYLTPSIWVARKDSAIDIDDKASLKGLTVGVQRGDIRDNYLSEFYADTLTIRRYATAEDVATDFEAGRLDLAMMDYPVALETLNFLSPDSPYQQVGPGIREPERIFGKGAAVAFRKRDKELAEKFNQALETVKQDGTYDRLMKKYFDYDIKI
ncbi:transporter substrate-binding domain-containing protein [Phytohalomonas tamaricis]|uniref:transporter substrate-binding domain-containing protein n=1 Tax=Phytohalomonas tamaricis TaxID=2081032 RepID=UPI000D0BC57C|nr:transporter substrate-binding domain-containing protein [Phytohalomonas tamaricis]